MLIDLQHGTHRHLDLFFNTSANKVGSHQSKSAQTSVADMDTDQVLGKTYTALLSALLLWLCVADHVSWTRLLLVSSTVLVLPLAISHVLTLRQETSAPATAPAPPKAAPGPTSPKIQTRPATPRADSAQSGSSAGSGKKKSSSPTASRTSTMTLVESTGSGATNACKVDMSLRRRSSTKSPTDTRSRSKPALCPSTWGNKTVRERRLSLDSLRSESPRRKFKLAVQQLKSKMPAVQEVLSHSSRTTTIVADASPTHKENSLPRRTTSPTNTSARSDSVAAPEFNARRRASTGHIFLGTTSTSTRTPESNRGSYFESQGSPTAHSFVSTPHSTIAMTPVDETKPYRLANQPSSSRSIPTRGSLDGLVAARRSSIFSSPPEAYGDKSVDSHSVGRSSGKSMRKVSTTLSRVFSIKRSSPKQQALQV